MKKQYYTTNEVAEVLNLNVQTVRKYVREGRLKGYYLGPHRLRIAIVDLQEFMSKKIGKLDYGKALA